MPEEEREPGPITTKYVLTVARAMEKKKGGKVSRKEEVVARKQEVMVARKVEKMVGMMAMKGDRAIQRKLLVMGVGIATVWKKRKMRLARKTVERKIRLERKILRRAKEKGRMLQRKEGAGYQTVPGKALSQRGLTMGLQVAR